MYASGEGVPADGPRAIALFRESAAEGETRAYAAIGDLYAQGEVVPEDQVEANAWYAEAGRHGDGKALFKLGEAYQRGRGVAADPVAALSWYTLAAQQGYERANDRSEALAATLDAAAVEAAEQRAAAWRRDNGLP
jgi:hypothetical protein